MLWKEYLDSILDVAAMFANDVEDGGVEVPLGVGPVEWAFSESFVFEAEEPGYFLV